MAWTPPVTFNEAAPPSATAAVMNAQFASVAAYADTQDALKANIASPTFTGTPAAPTASADTNSTQIATTAYVDTVKALKANLASPALTGTPTAPTASADTNTTQIATTAYADAIKALKANVASPTFTGTPAAPTASQGTNTTQLATTAYVQTEVGLLIPKSLVDAKGDIITATADNTPARLAVGSTDGHVLTVASGQATGLQWAAPASSSSRSVAVVRAATTANITISTALNNGDSLDGVTLATNDRVLVKDQTTAADNGIYVVGASPGRATDADAWNSEILGSEVYVSEGTVNKKTRWLNVNQEGGTLNTTAIRYTQGKQGYGWDSALLPDNGVFENFPRGYANNGNVVAATQAVYMQIGPTVPAGTTLSAINLYATIAAGTPTNYWAGIAAGPKESNARLVLATSADKTTTAWAANTWTTFTFGSSWTPDRDTGIYVFFMMKATTVVKLLGIGAWNANQNDDITPLTHGVSSTGQTGAPTAGSTTFAAVSDGGSGGDGFIYYYFT
jgi:hypothetical protein